MASRALSLATVVLLIGCSASMGQAQNLEAGKSPAQIFSGTCAVCHKSARGLLRTVAPGSLPSFLRQHYTTGTEMAGMLSAYVLANGATDARAKGGLTKQGEEAKSGRGADPVEAQPTRRQRDAQPQEAAKPDAAKPEAAKPDAAAPEAERLTPRQRRDARRRAREEERRAREAEKPEAGAAPAVATEEQPQDRPAAKKLGKKGKSQQEAPAKPDPAEAAKTEPGKTEPAKTEPGKTEPAEDRACQGRRYGEGRRGQIGSRNTRTGQDRRAGRCAEARQCRRASVRKRLPSSRMQSRRRARPNRRRPSPAAARRRPTFRCAPIRCRR